MGMFSWIDVDGTQNITDEDAKVVMLIPNEHRAAVAKVFGAEMTDRGIEGKYDGYGSVVDKNGVETDVYDAMTFVNICLTSDEQYADIAYRNHFSGETKAVAESVRQAYKDGKIATKADLLGMVEGTGVGELRTIGIDIACYDEQNARIPYPIKWTVNDSKTYENSNFSMSDPNQGFYKVNVAEKSSYEYYEGDWDYGDDSDPYLNYCDSDMSSKYNACEDYEGIEEERDKILAEVRAEREKANQELSDGDLDRDDDDGLGLD